MSDLMALFQQYSKAANKLLEEYGDRKSDLFQGETVTQFEFSHGLQSLEWLRESLPGMAGDLIPVGFTMRASLVVDDYQATLLLREEGGGMWADVEHEGEYPENEASRPIPEVAVSPLMALQERLHATRAGIRMDEVYSLLETVAQAGADVQVKMALFLDKRAVQRRFLAGVEESARPKLLIYLFPNSLARAVNRVSLEILEQEYFHPTRRAVWLVFSLEGCLEGDYLTVFGQGGNEKLARLLGDKLTEDALQANTNVINLRRLTGIWSDAPNWLTPDIFNLRPSPSGNEAAMRELHAHLLSIRAMLSALYLADQVDKNEDCFRVCYRGLGSASFFLGGASIQANTTRIDDVYALYAYAFAGFSPDKVEITQQFLSLMVETPAGLIEKAREVLEATQKTYQERVLVERVRDYFEARHKVQERLRAATESASSSLIELSREVSSDVYKIAGVLGAAVVAALIQPDITLVAILAASTVMLLYLALVLFYHLPTLQRANQLSQQGHKAGIRSFGDVLSVSEVEGYLQDEQLGKAQALLEHALRRAGFIYRAFFLVAALIFIAVVLTLLR
jgi:hypothetical protein